MVSLYFEEQIRGSENDAEKITMKLFNQVSISSGNRIQLSPNTRLRKCVISIGDSENHIQVEDAQVRRCSITIEGRGNRLIIHKGCNLRGLTIEVLGNDCTLEIGKNVKNTGPENYHVVKEALAL